MSLRHRLARLERAIAARRRPAEQRTDFERIEREFRELHADPVRLGMLRAIRSLMYRRDMTFEQVAEQPDGAAILERLRDHLATRAAPCA